MCCCKVADVDKGKGTGSGDFRFVFALDKISNSLVGGIQGIEGVEVVDDGAEDERGVDGAKCKVWFFRLDKVPSGFFGKRFAGSITFALCTFCLFESDWVPVLLGIGVLRPVSFR